MSTLKIRNAYLFDENQEALRTRDLFISMASHELKTPVTTVSAYINLLRSKIISGEKVDEKWLNTLESETKRLGRIVNELLDIDYISKGKLQFEMGKISIVPLIEEIAQNFSYSFPKRKLIIKNLVRKNTRILGDRDRLLQVFDNIMVNAAKFSFAETEIKFTARENKKDIVVKITNHGHGISKKDLPHLFERFYKAEADKPGMGLGLYISANIIKEHGGEISVESLRGKYTTFTIRLPRN